MLMKRVFAVDTSGGIHSTPPRNSPATSSPQHLLMVATQREVPAMKITNSQSANKTKKKNESIRKVVTTNNKSNAKQKTENKSDTRQKSDPNASLKRKQPRGPRGTLSFQWQSVN